MTTNTAGLGGGAGLGGALLGGADLGDRAQLDSGGAAHGGDAVQLTGGAGAQAAGGSGGSLAAGGVGGRAGSGTVGGTPSSAGEAGATTNGGAGWIVPADPGAGWNGPQDPACPAMSVSRDAACTSPLGTRCSYPSSGDYTLRCQCYTSSTGAARWWCQDHASIGYDSCPVAYPGSGSCPNIGDVTCYYVDPEGMLEACNCYFGALRCSPWGL